MGVNRCKAPRDSCAVTIATYKPPPRKRLRLSFGSREFTGLIWQILVVAIVVAVIVWLWSNTVHNLSARRISTGFAFLGREAGMPIADTWLAYSPKDTYLWAFVVGVTNTLRVAAIGIVLATILGTMIGIARLQPTGCCRGLPQSISKSCATFRCCCNYCSGTC